MRNHGLLLSLVLLPIAAWHGYSQTQIDLRTQSKSVDFSAAASTKPSKTGAVLPSNCSVGETFFKTDAPAGQNLYGCTAQNVWSPLNSGGSGVTSVGLSMPGEFAVGGSPVTTSGTLAVTKAVQSANAIFAGPAGGAASAPAFRPLETADIPNLAGVYQARNEKNAANGYAGLDSTGKVPASQGQEVWRISDLADAAGKQGTGNVVQMFGGGAVNAEDCAKFDAGGNIVSTGAPCWTGGANYAAAFSAQTTVAVPGTLHQLGTANLIVECYDGGSPAARVEPNSVTVHPTTYDVTITFSSLQSGKCVINGLSGGGGGTGGAVASVFSRAGAVVAQSGDYSFSQLSGTVSNTQIATGLDAGKIGTGSVDNTELGRLDGVTSPVQTQLDGKAAAAHTHSASGDVTGTIGSTTVVAFRNRIVASTLPQNGQALVWNSTLSQWEPQNQAGSGINATQIQGRNVSAAAPSNSQALVWSSANNQWEPGTVSGPGAGMSSQLADLAATYSSSKILAIGAGCTATIPCNVRFGNTTYTFTSSASVTLSSGTGTAYIYVTPSGALTVGHNLTLSCSGCTAANSVTAFPADSLPLFTWTATSGVWDAGGVDRRAFLSAKTTVGGTGTVVSESAGQTTVAVDTAVVGLRVSAPPTAGSSCTTGAWASDSSYFYTCVATNTWRRTVLSSW